MSWDALVKKTFRKKEEILPMQMAEVRRTLPIIEGYHPTENKSLRAGERLKLF